MDFVLQAGVPSLVVLLLPGIRSWFLAALAYTTFLWLAWPRCETAGDVGCNMGKAMFTLIATPLGAAVLSRGFQFAFLPWQQWWLRIVLALGTLAIAGAAYRWIWYR